MRPQHFQNQSSQLKYNVTTKNHSPRLARTKVYSLNPLIYKIHDITLIEDRQTHLQNWIKQKLDPPMVLSKSIIEEEKREGDEMVLQYNKLEKDVQREEKKEFNAEDCDAYLCSIGFYSYVNHPRITSRKRIWVVWFVKGYHQEIENDVK